MITVNVAIIPLQPVISQTGVLERTDLVAYLVQVMTDPTGLTPGTEWREEFTEPERVRAFIRGVKAGLAAMATFAVHVNQPEWNV